MLRIARKLSCKNCIRKIRHNNLTRNSCPYSNKASESQQNESGGSKLLYTLGTLALAGGATLGYAKYDVEFRDTLVEYAPFTDDLLKLIFLEERGFDGLYQDIKASILSSFGTNKKKIDPDTVAKSLEKVKEYKAPIPVIPLLEKGKKEEETYTEIRLEQKDDHSVEIVGETKPKPETLAKTHPNTLVDLEEKICKATTEAVNAYNEAIYSLKVYSLEVNNVMDSINEKLKPSVWENLKVKTGDKVNSIKKAEEKAEEAIKDITTLKESLTNPELDISDANKEMIKINIQKAQDDINSAKKEYEREKKLSSVTEKYWEKVEKARLSFATELEMMFPTIDLSKRQLSISGDDLDLFLLYVWERVQFYQKELAKMETVMQERLNNAVEAAKRGDGEVLTSAQICEAIEEEKRRLTLCFQQECLELRKEADNKMREQLKLQSQIFSDHLEDAINLRGAEIERELTRKFDEQLECEKSKFKIQIAAMIGRLKGLEQALRLKDDADKMSKQSQVLWAACQTLLRAIETGCHGIPWKKQLRPLEPEITLIKKAAAEGDEFVDAVIKGIPKQAFERGVFPEDALKERFLKVEETARLLALVPEDGASLLIYILSYIQSLLLIKTASPIPNNELNDEEVNFSDFTTNEILQRARYWLDRGDLAQTLKYMNLLKGAPKSIAKDWMEEARILLETQQAANTLMAHASSSGLIYL